MRELLIIGCGLTGTVIANHFAKKGYNVTIWEKRNHIGGNMYDFVDKNGILVHKYGPHVFHTNKKELFDFMNNITNWNEFRIKCSVNMLNKITPSPFNFQTIDDYYSKEKAKLLKSELLFMYPNREKVTILELLESKNTLIKEYADFLFDNDYSLYTAKQWGISPKEIDPSVLRRVPVLLSYKDGYFDDEYQMIPKNGYVEIFDKLLNHPNIKVELEKNALDYIKIVNNEIQINGKISDKILVYTGPVDELLDFKYGVLPYRSLKFEWITEHVDIFQKTPLVAYPADVEFTRITEYKHFTQKAPKNFTSLAYEYPVLYDYKVYNSEPYYPILTEESNKMYLKYKNALNSIPNLFLAGRLSDFKYYNMDQTLERALKICSMIEKSCVIKT
ncbi:MAG: UDP-galactopyranose mutase [Anaerorhabdus sp.]|uniref:UDP-galactopyranose mutase n=1 Tax=Anaerorhabdus sp. TaxID=1872524 RepID=UPI002FCA49AD